MNFYDHQSVEQVRKVKRELSDFCGLPQSRFVRFTWLAIESHQHGLPAARSRKAQEGDGVGLFVSSYLVFRKLRQRRLNRCAFLRKSGTPVE
jgi:hypothetical protein